MKEGSSSFEVGPTSSGADDGPRKRRTAFGDSFTGIGGPVAFNRDDGLSKGRGPGEGSIGDGDNSGGDGDFDKGTRKRRRGLSGGEEAELLDVGETKDDPSVPGLKLRLTRKGISFSISKIKKPEDGGPLMSGGCDVAEEGEEMEQEGEEGWARELTKQQKRKKSSPGSSPSRFGLDMRPSEGGAAGRKGTGEEGGTVPTDKKASANISAIEAEPEEGQFGVEKVVAKEGEAALYKSVRPHGSSLAATPGDSVQEAGGSVGGGLGDGGNMPVQVVKGEKIPTGMVGAGSTQMVLENLSQGQQVLAQTSEGETGVGPTAAKRLGADPTVSAIQAGKGTLAPAPTSGGPLPTGGAVAAKDAALKEVYRIPSHAGWFVWNKIHPIERRALPEFFNGRSASKTPKIYKEYRDFIISKYRENPYRLLTFTEVRRMLIGDVNAIRRVFEFLDHWGLINYLATDDSKIKLPAWAGSPTTLVEDAPGGLRIVSPAMTPANSLYKFEPPHAGPPPAAKPSGGLLSTRKNVYAQAASDAALKEMVGAKVPVVEYHCNACGTDCSRRRYHCQRQADFDLCPDCFADGKFGPGMTASDFIRMDAQSERNDPNSDEWTDQETLLLLEALELYAGDNWHEIAEHVGTKTKAQCILHFIRLPIEDPFLEEMEMGGAVHTVDVPAAPADVSQPSEPKGGETAHAAQGSGGNALLADAQIKDREGSGKASSSAPDMGGDGSGEATDGKSNKRDEEKDNQEGETAKLVEAEKNSGKEETIKKVKESRGAPDNSEDLVEASAVIATAARKVQGETLISKEHLPPFADASNPVMAQVAFLAAMVGPRVAAAAAQSALAALMEEGQGHPPTSLELSKQGVAGLKDTGVSTHTMLTIEKARGTEGVTKAAGTAAQTQILAGKDSSKPTSWDRGMELSSTVAAPMEVDAKDKPTTEEAGAFSAGVPGGSKETGDKETRLEAAPRTEGDDGAEEGSAKHEAAKPVEEPPSALQVRAAAATAIAAAAVKAKLLADQEEREIQRLVASVIEMQLKKLEIKLRYFDELEDLLEKEREQIERARQKLFEDRVRLAASRLARMPPPAQLLSAMPAGIYQPTPTTHPNGSTAMVSAGTPPLAAAVNAEGNNASTSALPPLSPLGAAGSLPGTTVGAASPMQTSPPGAPPQVSAIPGGTAYVGTVPCPTVPGGGTSSAAVSALPTRSRSIPAIVTGQSAATLGPLANPGASIPNYSMHSSIGGSPLGSVAGGGGKGAARGSVKGSGTVASHSSSSLGIAATGIAGTDNQPPPPMGAILSALPPPMTNINLSSNVNHSSGLPPPTATQTASTAATTLQPSLQQGGVSSSIQQAIAPLTTTSGN
ncbi:hypothetical protein CBR_g23440 [Chara braunii]|uniref:Uncharacterized protein n=1 Tax=Chara braunii TaxID=69332 RepID=A0A388L478_CHABU|nr:hypothetical protein CBR_g23440 [Chara braunii]|eukprot:GBG77115.1 hypothetical protein CBR_g23440 [Chara braunii]